MTKSDIIEVVAKEANITKKAAREIIDAFLSEVIRNLKKGEKVVVSGFGTFKVTKVKDKKGRNPQTGKDLVIKGHKAVRFLVSKSLKKEVK
ncbi:HU family DNA-binding protein [Candidatus Beckwithbacteria bacterium]|nr:HU family DNA-binding protein [Candidatus Beckwithbacteria bacterium]